MLNIDTTRGPVTETRQIIYRTKGHRHGPITRLMSPGDLGELLKPFVFLDLFESSVETRAPFAIHPHSGLATFTTLLSGSTLYADSTGKAGLLAAGDVEWMRAGGGVWHGGVGLPNGPIRGFQLWVALPPELELAPALSQYVKGEDVPDDGSVRVLLGSYQGRQSPVEAPSDMTYLHVRLADGQRWLYQPERGHTVAWTAVCRGGVMIGETRIGREIAVFEEGDAAIEFTAHGDAEFVVGSAAKHPYPLVTGMYSVHTGPDALFRGEAGIKRVAKTMELTPGGMVTPELVRRMGGQTEPRQLPAGT
ncbi:MAG: pirin family protein [Polyangiaceae bacterium]|nr:pirin family protein [Polyangiaceae bacterium]